jgi:hypothetical protein
VPLAPIFTGNIEKFVRREPASGIAQGLQKIGDGDGCPQNWLRADYCAAQTLNIVPAPGI